MRKIMIFLMLLGSCSVAHATPKEVLCVIGEAEGEGYKGMLAVSEAIRNRGTLKGVYGCSAPRVVQKKYSKEVMQTAIRAWDDSANTRIVKGATHWEGTAFKTPYWAKDMILTATIGRQKFFREKEK